MTVLYPIALFLHVVGALVLFAAIAIDWITSRQLRRAELTAELPAVIQIRRLLSLFFPVATLLILIPGIYMSVALWGAPAWIVTSFSAVIVLWIAGQLARTAALRDAPVLMKAVATGGPLPAEARARLRDQTAWSLLNARTGLALGVVLLMTAKPGLIASLAVVAVGILLGWLLGWATSRAADQATVPVDRG